MNQAPDPVTEPTENQEEPAVQEPMPQAPDLERLIAEAEERGYRRGREEASAEMAAHQQPDESSEILILACQRPSIWD